MRTDRAIARQQGEIAEIKNRLDELGERLEAVCAALGTLCREVNELRLAVQTGKKVAAMRELQEVRSEG